MRCPTWSAKHASFGTVALLLGLFLHGFLRGNVYPNDFQINSFNNGVLVAAVAHRFDDLTTNQKTLCF